MPGPLHLTDPARAAQQLRAATGDGPGSLRSVHLDRDGILHLTATPEQACFLRDLLAFDNEPGCHGDEPDYLGTPDCTDPTRFHAPSPAPRSATGPSARSGAHTRGWQCREPEDCGPVLLPATGDLPWPLLSLFYDCDHLTRADRFHLARGAVPEPLALPPQHSSAPVLCLRCRTTGTSNPAEDDWHLLSLTTYDPPAWHCPRCLEELEDLHGCTAYETHFGTRVLDLDFLRVLDEDDGAVRGWPAPAILRTST